MSLSIDAIPTPLRIDADGSVRVGKTRVLLATVITAFYHGESAEEIAENFPTLDLADAYGVIAYYLRHRAEVDAYMDEYRRQAEALRREIEARFPSQGLRERLLARRAAAVSPKS